MTVKILICLQLKGFLVPLECINDPSLDLPVASEDPMPKCPEYEKLEADVSSSLEFLSDLTKRQLEAFQAGKQTLFVRLDKELENAVGAKERKIGALRQHAKDH